MISVYPFIATYAAIVAVGVNDLTDVLKEIKEAGNWSEHTLNIGLIVIVLVAGFFVMRANYKQLAEEKKARGEDAKLRDVERSEYIESLKTIILSNSVIIDRNSEAFKGIKETAEKMDKIDRDVHSVLMSLKVMQFARHGNND